VRLLANVVEKHKDGTDAAGVLADMTPDDFLGEGLRRAAHRTADVGRAPYAKPTWTQRPRAQYRCGAPWLAAAGLKSIWPPLPT